MTVRNITCAADAMQRQHENFMKLCELSYEGFGYDFSLTRFTKGIKSIVEVGCPKHGRFRTRAKKLLAGRGCIKCNQDSLMDHDAMIYVVKCYNEDESFYKIGVTTKTMHERLGEYSVFPYKYEVLSLLTGDRKKIYQFEAVLLRLLREYRYRPKRKFCGATECFSDIGKLSENFEINSILSIDLFKRRY